MQIALRTQIFDKTLIAIRCLGEMVIHVELYFSENLDPERLAKAVELLLKTEPVLGCRFITDIRKAFWEKVAVEKRKTFFSVETEDAYEAFRRARHDIETTVAFKVCHWSTTSGDRLLVKIAHEAADAGGCKEAIRQLANTYSQLKYDPGYQPSLNHGSRSAWQALRHIPLYRYPTIFLNYFEQTYKHLRYRPAFMLPMATERSDRPFYVLRHLPRDRIKQAVKKARSLGATINDMVLTAFTRAVMIEGKWDGASNLKTAYTVDFRKHLIPGGKAEAICNISGFEYLNLGKAPGTTAEDTLVKVALQTSARKKNYPGVNDIAGGIVLGISLIPANALEQLGMRFLNFIIRKKLMADGITNLGEVDKADVTFDTAPAGAWLVAPPIYPPTLLVGVSGYDGNITLSCASYRPAMTPADVEKFLDRMETEMPGFDAHPLT